MKNLTIIAIIMSFMLLFGCATKSSVQKIAIRNDTYDMRIAAVKLANSAQSASQSLEELAAIERAVHPVPKVPNPPNPEVIRMAQITSIDWIGPVGPLVEKIAKLSHYKVRVLGTPPAIPILVSITAKNTPLADILRDANFQCGTRANLAVYAAERVIELRYAKS